MMGILIGLIEKAKIRNLFGIGKELGGNCGLLRDGMRLGGAVTDLNVFLTFLYA